jgi:hypothetical protein
MHVVWSTNIMLLYVYYTHNTYHVHFYTTADDRRTRHNLSDTTSCCCKCCTWVEYGWIAWKGISSITWSTNQPSLNLFDAVQQHVVYTYIHTALYKAMLHSFCWSYCVIVGIFAHQAQQLMLSHTTLVHITLVCIIHLTVLLLCAALHVSMVLSVLVVDMAVLWYDTYLHQA